MSLEALHRIVRGEEVERRHASDLLRAFADGGATSEQLAAFLTALTIRGENIPALLGFVDVLRERYIPVDLGDIPAMCVCGTGGDGQHTVNLSTSSAFVVAAAGVPVAKHGNHAVSSMAGSADVLGALQVPYKLDPAGVAAMVKEIGLGFIYAPAHHPLFAKIGPVRRLLGFRTAFNLLGPIVNPAQVKRQVIGAPSVKIMHLIAETLAELGTDRAMVVHTPGPYDEVSLTAPAKALLVEKGSITDLEFTPSDFGAETILPQDLVGGDAESNAQRIIRVFQGEESPLRNAICANAACALLVAGRVADVREGYALAQDVIARGLVLEKLKQAQEFRVGVA